MATFNPERFAEAMAKAPARLFKALEKRLSAYGRWFASNKMARQVSGGGARLSRRSGSLAGSFGRDVTGKNLSDLRLTVFTTARYAPLQEFGGEVRPVARKYLTVPLDAALTAEAGATRSRAEGWGRERTFVAEAADGRAYIFLRTGTPRPSGWKPGQDDPSSVPLFLLTRKVTVPARLGFFATWEGDKEERMAEVAAAVDEALDGLGGA